MTEELFEKVEVLGVQSVTIHPTPEADAHGWSEAFGPVPLLLNAGRAFCTAGRGERIRAETFQLSYAIEPAGQPNAGMLDSPNLRGLGRARGSTTYG